MKEKEGLACGDIHIGGEIGLQGIYRPLDFPILSHLLW